MYLVTGGGGFIGSHLVRELVKRGERVRVFDNSSSGTKQRISDILNDVEWVDGDLRDRDAVERACEGIEVIHHHAALASVPASIADPATAHEINVTGTLNVLMAAHAAGTRRVVFASSSAVYGNSPVTPKRETIPVAPLSPYAVHKLTGEWYLRVWQDIYHVETVALRYFNVFGPAQDPNGQYAAVIPRFITSVLEGRAPTIYGDGEQSRDFVFIGDVVAANLLAATMPDAPGNVINIGTGRSMTLNTLISMLSAITGLPITPDYIAAQPGDVRESLADISRAQQVLGFTPATSFSEGLRQTYEAFRTVQPVQRQP